MNNIDPCKYSKEAAKTLGLEWSEDFHQDFQKVSAEWETASSRLTYLLEELPKLRQRHQANKP